MATLRRGSLGTGTFRWGLGANPEVFSGSSNEPLETAVPQQFFATSMLLTPLVRGLLGWEGDAPGDRITLAPHLPATWDSVVVRRLPVGAGRYTVRLTRDDSSFEAEVVRTTAGGVDTLVFAPALPLGAVLRDVTANGRPVACAPRSTGADVHVDCRLTLGPRLAIAVRHTPGWEVLVPLPDPAPGARSSALKLLTQRLAGDTLVLEVEGRAGWAYRVGVRTPYGRRDITIDVPEGGTPVDGYRTTVVRVTSPR